MKIEMSNGEIIDRTTILLIKIQNITDQQKIENIERELHDIMPVADQIINIMDSKFSELLEINGKLWDIEDKIRMKERAGEFDEEFIELARSVYITNDKRSELKRKINKISGSTLHEEKSYEQY